MSHAVGRRLPGRSASIAVVVALCAAVVALVLPAHPFSAGSPSLGRTSMAAQYRGAHASLRRVGRHAELTISDMPQAPVGEVYEVWLARRGTAQEPTDALFTVTRDGRGAVEVPGNLHGIRAVTVTAEPVGGSARPTSAAVLTVLLGQGSGA